MIVFSIRVFIFIMLYSVVFAFDDEDFHVLLCAADEDNMEHIIGKCEPVLRDAVDGCFEKCFIEMRNTRAPTTRIDEKYYQFVMCDTALWDQWKKCVIPCVSQLKISYDGFEVIHEWSDCIIETVRSFEYIIEHQDDPEPPKGGNNPKGGKGAGKKNVGGSGSKGKSKKKNDTKDNSKAINKGNPKGQGKGNDSKNSDRISNLKMKMNNV